jgi:uncharacterized protein YjbI with pentapeptide repeats
LNPAPDDDLTTERTIGTATLTLPHLDHPDLALHPLDQLHTQASHFTHTGGDLRALDLSDARLDTGRVTGLRTARATWDETRLHTIEFEGCALGELRWTGGRAARVVFRDCQLLGAVLADVRLDNVLFENCRLTYATFQGCKATGPLAFVNCDLTEATFGTCDLTRAAIVNCTANATEFGPGTYRATDLRGTDLTTARGIPHLTGITIDPTQTLQLAHALTTELAITHADPLPEPETP